MEYLSTFTTNSLSGPGLLSLGRILVRSVYREVGTAMHIEREFEVGRPVQDVFEYLSDVTNEAKWNPWAKWVRKVSDGPARAGTVFRGSYEGFGELEQDLSVYEPPARLTYHSVPKGMSDATMSFELSDSGKGTLVRVVGEVETRGAMKLLEPMMAMRMKPHLADVEKGMVRELG